jgi:hypothetical protein
VSEDAVVALVLVRPDEAEPVARALRAEGFLVGPHVGISMAITAPRRSFERVFGVRVEDAADGGWVAAGGGRELPLGQLPPGLAERIDAVTFDEPGETTP